MNFETNEKTKIDIAYDHYKHIQPTDWMMIIKFIWPPNLIGFTHTYTSYVCVDYTLGCVRFLLMSIMMMMMINSRKIFFFWKIRIFLFFLKGLCPKYITLHWAMNESSWKYVVVFFHSTFVQVEANHVFHLWPCFFWIGGFHRFHSFFLYSQSFWYFRGEKWPKKNEEKWRKTYTTLATVIKACCLCVIHGLYEKLTSLSMWAV